MKVVYQIINRTEIKARGIILKPEDHIEKILSHAGTIVDVLGQLDKNLLLNKVSSTIILMKDIFLKREFWLYVEDYKRLTKNLSQFEERHEEKQNVTKTSYRMIDEHFGKADTSIEIVDLGEGNICVIHSGGMAEIYQSIHDMASKRFLSKSNIEYLTCEEKQLEFIYTYFKDYYDIKNNFDVINTKRKENKDGR